MCVDATRRDRGAPWTGCASTRSASSLPSGLYPAVPRCEPGRQDSPPVSARPALRPPKPRKQPPRQVRARRSPTCSSSRSRPAPSRRRLARRGGSPSPWRAAWVRRSISPTGRSVTLAPPQLLSSWRTSVSPPITRRTPPCWSRTAATSTSPSSSCSTHATTRPPEPLPTMRSRWPTSSGQPTADSAKRRPT